MSLDLDRQCTLLILQETKDMLVRETAERERLLKQQDEIRTALDVKADWLAAAVKVIAACEAELSGRGQEAAE